MIWPPPRGPRLADELRRLKERHRLAFLSYQRALIDGDTAQADASRRRFLQASSELAVSRKETGPAAPAASPAVSTVNPERSPQGSAARGACQAEVRT